MKHKSLTEREREAMRLLWTLAVLTPSQLSRLSSGGHSVRWAQDTLGSLAERGFVERDSRRLPWDTRRDGRRPHVYRLFGDGVFRAGIMWENLTRRSAARMYAGICQERLTNHALLRNEYLAELADAIRAHGRGLVLDFVGGERHAWQRAFPGRSKSPGCYPDGVAVIQHESHPGLEFTILIEAHTGSQTSARTMAKKVNQYCKEGGAVSEQAWGSIPRHVKTRVLFVAPDRRKAEQAWRLALTVEEGPYLDYRVLKKRREIADPADLFLFTDIERVLTEGALASTYFSLTPGRRWRLFS